MQCTGNKANKKEKGEEGRNKRKINFKEQNKIKRPKTKKEKKE